MFFVNMIAGQKRKPALNNTGNIGKKIFGEDFEPTLEATRKRDAEVLRWQRAGLEDVRLIGLLHKKKLDDLEAQRVVREAGAQHKYDAVVAERDAFVVERGAFFAERNTVAAERDALVAERDAVIAERDTVVAERDAVIAERNELLRNLRATQQARDAAVQEKMGKDEEIDSLHAANDWLTKELKATQEAARKAEEENVDVPKLAELSDGDLVRLTQAIVAEQRRRCAALKPICPSPPDCGLDAGFAASLSADSSSPPSPQKDVLDDMVEDDGCSSSDDDGDDESAKPSGPTRAGAGFQASIHITSSRKNKSQSSGKASHKVHTGGIVKSTTARKQPGTGKGEALRHRLEHSESIQDLLRMEKLFESSRVRRRDMPPKYFELDVTGETIMQSRESDDVPLFSSAEARKMRESVREETPYLDTDDVEDSGIFLDRSDSPASEASAGPSLPDDATPEERTAHDLAEAEKKMASIGQNVTMLNKAEVEDQYEAVLDSLKSSFSSNSS